MSDSDRLEKIPGIISLSDLPMTKFYRPSTNNWFLYRPKLNRQLGVYLSFNIILVIAPAGYGKTSLVSKVIEDHCITSAWVSLDRRDNQPAQFWRNFIAALHMIWSNIGKDSLSMVSNGTQSINRMLITLINEIIQINQEVWIALDDYHYIVDDVIQESLVYLVENIPSKFHIFITSRTPLERLPPRLRGCGKCVEITKDDLQFSIDETSSYLNDKVGLNLSTDQINDIHTKLEGWLAGLQIFALSMHGKSTITDFSSFKKKNTEIMEYLSHEVLSQLDSKIQNFLIETSILDRLTAPLCNHITGYDNSQGILELLLSNRLFVEPLDDKNEWFRYHHLFRDLLYKELLNKKPDSIVELSKRASKWYEDNGSLEAAIEYAFNANDFEKAFELISKIAFKILGQDKHNLLIEWIDRFPQEWAERSILVWAADLFSHEAIRQTNRVKLNEKWLNQPEIFANTTLSKGFIAAATSLLSYNSGNLNQALNIGECALQTNLENDPQGNCAIHYVLGLVYWSLGNLEFAFNAYQKCLILCKDQEYTFTTIQAIVALAHIQFCWGHLQSAEEKCREAVQFAKTHGCSSSTAMIYVHLLLGEIYYQWNLLEDSRLCIKNCLALITEEIDPIIQFNIQMAIAKINIIEGEIEAASEIALKAKETLDKSYRGIAYISLSRLWLLLGNVATANDYSRFWIDLSNQDMHLNKLSYSIVLHDIRNIWSESPTLTEIRLKIAHGDLDGLLDIINNAAQESFRIKNQSLYFELSVQKCMALMKENDTKKALDTLISVLKLTETEKFIRIYADEGIPMQYLISLINKQHILPQYTATILAAFEKNKNQREITGQKQFNSHALTKRQIEVIRLISMGFSNKSISEKLGIAISTVKNHTHAIYEILEVSNRTQAVKCASYYGFLNKEKDSD